MDLFHTLVWGHIATGAVGIVVFWVPVLGRKGGDMHRRWGRIFVRAMLATGSIAMGISACTLHSPLPTHPQFADAALIRGIFGWMMLYLALLTISLAWHGWLAVLNRQDHAANGAWHNVALQYLVMAAALNCALQGWWIGQPLMMGISIVGIASGLTNLYFIRNPRPQGHHWLHEHIKALVGAGISVYTAFLAFGAVRLMPSLALEPMLWAVPLTIGLALIIHHQREVRRRLAPRPQGSFAVPGGTARRAG